MTIEELVSIGVDNISICKSLGFTGRLFAIENEHLSVLEGAADLIENYFQAFSGDERVGSTLRHFSRLIESREFPDLQPLGQT